MSHNLHEQLFGALKDRMDSFTEEERKSIKKILADVSKTYIREAVEGETPEIKEIKIQIRAQLLNLGERAQREVKIAISDTLQKYAVRVAQSFLAKAVG